MLPLAEAPDRTMRLVQRINHRLLADLVGLSLNHHQGILFSGHDQVHVTLLGLLHRRVHDKLSVDARHAHLSNRPLERRPRKHESCGGAYARHHVGVVFRSGRDDEVYEVDIVVKPVRKQGADGPINEPRRKGFLISWASLPLNKPARHLPSSGKLLTVVHSQREEVRLLHRVADCGGGEHHGVSHAHHDRPVGLLRNASSLKGKRALRRKFDFFNGRVRLHMSLRMHSTSYE